jgi:hypothetical protein
VTASSSRSRGCDPPARPSSAPAARGSPSRRRPSASQPTAAALHPCLAPVIAGAWWRAASRARPEAGCVRPAGIGTNEQAVALAADSLLLRICCLLARCHAGAPPPVDAPSSQAAGCDAAGICTARAGYSVRTAVRTGPGRRPAPALIALLISISDSATRCIHCTVHCTRRSIFQLRIRTQPAGAETPRCAGLLSMRRSPACLNDRMVQWLLILQSRHLTADVRRSCCRSVDSVATAMARPEL